MAVQVIAALKAAETAMAVYDRAKSAMDGMDAITSRDQPDKVGDPADHGNLFDTVHNLLQSKNDSFSLVPGGTSKENDMHQGLKERLLDTIEADMTGVEPTPPSQDQEMSM